VSVKVIAPVWVPTDKIRMNLTPTVQLAPGARAAPVQVSVPLIQAQISPAPVTATLVTATFDPPAAAVLVRVTVLVPVSVPAGSVIVSGFGVIDTVAVVATPVPLIETGEPVTVAPV